MSGQYYETLSMLWGMVIEANEGGDYFPLWGTCFGFQEISMLAAQDLNLLNGPLDSENYTIALNLTDKAATSRMFTNASDVLHILATSPVTMNNHRWGVSPAKFNANQYLPNFFDVLSTNVDRNGVEFISTMEAKKYPIYATQWHPEKPIYEWNIHEVIDHSKASVYANQHTCNFLVEESLKSDHQFPTVEEETAALIYNYNPVYTYNQLNDFEQCYFW